MKSLIFIAFFNLASTAFSAPQGLYSGATGAPVVLIEELAQRVRPGSVVVVGENHGFSVHQGQQMAILSALRDLGFKVSVGLEFFSYPDQQRVHEYRLGYLSESDFLKQINWGSGFDFGFYKSQALFPRYELGEQTWALNTPRFLTSKVAKSGLDSLTPQEAALLPPQFTLGRDSYRVRFFESIPHPLPPPAQDKYFAAQSIWDDTMAWRAKQFLEIYPEQVLVIIVGEFHVQYGGGLPDRLRARGVTDILTFSQVDSTEASSAAELLAPSPRDGVRADYLWLAPLGKTAP